MDCKHMEIALNAREKILQIYGERGHIVVCMHGWQAFLDGKTEHLEHLYRPDGNAEIAVWLKPPVKDYPYSHGICREHLEDALKGREFRAEELRKELPRYRPDCEGCESVCIANPGYLEMV